MCIPCSHAETEPDYLSITRNAQGDVTSTTLYVCDYYAKQIYAPGIDPNTPDLLTSKMTAFD